MSVNLSNIVTAHNALAVMLLSGAKTVDQLAEEFDLPKEKVPNYLLDGVNDLVFGKGSPLFFMEEDDGG